MKFEEWKKLLSSPESSDRSEAADMLPDDGEESEIVSSLVQALSDVDLLVRASAAETLGTVDSDDGRDALRSALRIETEELPRGYVISSLGRMGNLADLKLLVDEARSQDVSAWGKLHCAQGIAILAVDYAVRSIVAATKGPDWKLSAAAFSHLESIADLLESNGRFIVDVARECEGSARSGIEKDAISSILSRVTNPDSHGADEK